VVQASDDLKRIRLAWNNYKADTKSSQAAAAKAIGMNQSAFSQYLRGEIPLNTDFLMKFSALTGTDITEFGLGIDVSTKVNSYKMEVRYTLSGKKLKETVPVTSIVPNTECFLIRNDYADHMLINNSYIIIDPREELRVNDLVILFRLGEPLIFGNLIEDEETVWEVLEPHATGGRRFLMDENSIVHRVSGTYAPLRQGKVYER